MTMATSGNMLPSAPQKNISPPTYSDDDDLGKTSISLPSFGGSFDCLSQNGNGKALHTPLLSELPPMISRTPLPVIGGRYIEYRSMYNYCTYLAGYYVQGGWSMMFFS